MANRGLQAQMEHDSVIAAREGLWKGDRRCSQSWANPDGEQKASYTLENRKLYPDIIVQLRDKDGAKIGLEEVETADSISESEAKQWRDYAALNKAFFNLLVPTNRMAEARELAKGIALTVVGYSKGRDGYSFSTS